MDNDETSSHQRQQQKHRDRSSRLTPIPKLLLIFAVTLFAGNTIRNTTRIDNTEDDTSYDINDKTMPPTIEPSQGVEWAQIGDSLDGDIKHKLLTNHPVAISDDGNRVVMGSAWDEWDYEQNKDDEATVRVFDLWNGTQWNETGRISGNSSEGFGWNIALAGKGGQLAVGARLSSNYSGHAEVYSEADDSNDWIKQDTNFIGDEENDLLGRTLAISEKGNVIVVGAPWSSSYGRNNTSYVKVFQFKEDDGWIQKGDTIFGSVPNDKFGFSVAISADGNTVAVGAPNSHDNGDVSGSVEVYQFSPHLEEGMRSNEKNQQQRRNLGRGGWKQLGQTLKGDDSWENFGTSLALNAAGTKVAVGAPWANSWNGYVKVYRLNGDTWDRMGQNIVGDVEEWLGYSISMTDDTLVVGAPRDLAGGHVETYKFDGDNWAPSGSFLLAPQDENFYGGSVSLSGNGKRLAVGSIYMNNGRMTVYDSSLGY